MLTRFSRRKTLKSQPFNTSYQCWQKDVCRDDRPIETLSRPVLVERLPIFVLQARVSVGRISQLKLHICHYEVESAFELKSSPNSLYMLCHSVSLGQVCCNC
jgi:hypothetical protein